MSTVFNDVAISNVLLFLYYLLSLECVAYCQHRFSFKVVCKLSCIAWCTFYRTYLFYALFDWHLIVFNPQVVQYYRWFILGKNIKFYPVTTGPIGKLAGQCTTAASTFNLAGLNIFINYTFFCKKKRVVLDLIVHIAESHIFFHSSSYTFKMSTWIFAKKRQSIWGCYQHRVCPQM